MFDRYTPMGLDCEATIQLRRLSDRPRACVFDWQWVGPEALVSILRNDFAGYFQLPNLVLSADRRHVVDTAYDVQFHHLWTLRLDGTIMPQQIARDYPRVRARSNYLLRRWRETVRSPLTVLYVRRDPYHDLTAKNMVEFRDVMRECYPAHRFAVLWMRNPTAPDAAGLGEVPTQLDDGLYVSAMPVQLPRAEHWRGDDAAWDRFFPTLRDVRPVTG